MSPENYYFSRWPSESPHRPRTTRHVAASDLATALNLAVERRESSSHVVEHSSRVAHLSCRLAELVEVGEVEMDALRTAATHHEIGMIGVPADLLTRTGRLNPVELNRVRIQAAFGAEIVRAAYGSAAARLIERQYSNYTDLRRSTVDSRELLLAGILRVSDVFDAMLRPRPYQPPAEDEEWRNLFRVGSGTRFHPAAVYAILHLSHPTNVA